MLITKKDIFILGKGLTDGLEDTAITAETENSINFMEMKKKFCLSLHYSGSKRFLLVNGIKSVNLKQKTLK